MKRTLLSLLLLALLTTPAAAQQKSKAEQIDSIAAELPQLRDTAKINALRDLVELTLGLPTEILYLKMLREEARQQGNVEAEGFALANLTGVYYSQYDTDSVFIFGEETIRFAREHNLHHRLFFAHQQIIRRLQKDRQMLTALRKAEEAYAEAKELQQSRPLATILFLIGTNYYNLGQYEEAVRYFTESAEVADQDREGNAATNLLTYKNLAFMARYLHNPQEMLRYADSLRVQADLLAVVRPHVNIQREYFHPEFFRAIAYAELGQPANALRAIRRAEALYDPQWSEITPYFSAQIDDMYGAYYFATGNYNMALEHSNRLQEYYTKTGHFPSGTTMFVKHNIARAYSAKGDHKAAAETYRQIIHLTDLLNQEQFSAQITEFHTIYELDQAERKAELETERRIAAMRQHRIVVAGLGLVCIAMMLIIALIVWSRRKIAQKNCALYKRIMEEERIHQQLTEQIQHLSAQHPATDHTDSNGKATLLHALTTLMTTEQPFTDPDLTRKVLAKRLNTNETYLINTIRDNYNGQNFSDYINTFRLKHAQKLLINNTELSLKEIAWDAGFSTYKYFYQLFCDKFGMSPSNFRKTSQSVTCE